MSILKTMCVLNVLIRETNSKFKHMKQLHLKNFILRKDYLGKGYTIYFTNIHGRVIKYDHDILYYLVSDRLTKLPCWKNYGYYTNSRDMPVYMKKALENGK